MPLSSADRIFVAAYLGLASASAILVRRAGVRGKPGRTPALLLLFVAVVLTGIGLDRIFGVSERWANLARDSGRTEGWYNDRAVVQVIAIVSALVVIILALALLQVMRRDDVDMPGGVVLALVSAVMLVFLGVVRRVSLHEVDALFVGRIAGVRVVSSLETFVLTVLATALAWTWQSLGGDSDIRVGSRSAEAPSGSDVEAERTQSYRDQV